MEVSAPPAAPSPVPVPDAPAAPPVVAIVVTHDPGPWFAETLASLAAQTYDNLSVLVIDAASDDDPTGQVASVLPSAFVRRLDGNPGFGAAANEALGRVSGAAFFLLCHDDVALDPDAVRVLVQEAFRSNAGIVGPKLVDWHDPRHLRQVGLTADKTGVTAPLAEVGELDQEQHDGVRDVFVVPGACTLVRADLFEQLGGFDPTITFIGEDLDLCWRGHVAGARVLVAPAARVRHLEALDQRLPAGDRGRLAARHRLRTMLSCYRPFHLLRVLPQAALITLAEAIFALLLGRVGRARAALGAWTWNLRRLGPIRRKRRELRAVRSVPDPEVRELQVRGSARVSAFVRGQLGRDDNRLVRLRASVEQLGADLRSPRDRVPVVAAVVVATVLVLGTRNLFTNRIPAIGEFAAFPDSPFDLIRAYVSGWRTAGLGSDASAPTAFAVLGAAGTLLFGATDLLRQVLILGCLPVGAIGAWRLARPLGSARASSAAFVVYVAIPVPYNALASGSWGGLAVYATTPWVVLALARASRLAPYGPVGTDPRRATGVDITPPRTLARQIVALGLILALAAVIVPFVLAVALVIAVAMVLGSLFCGRFAGNVRMMATAAGGSVLAAALHLPWALDFLPPGAEWHAFAGVRAGEGGVLSAGAVFRFESGPFGAPPLGWAFLVAAALPMILGRGWRLEWAVRAWFVALAGWGVLWAGQEDWIPLALPSPEVLLAPAAIGLALAAALGMTAFEVDLPGYRFGWRQAASFAAAAAVLIGALPLAAGLIDGRWKLPGADFNRRLGTTFEAGPDVPARVLWLGDPKVVPVAGWPLDDRTIYATTDRGVPTVENLWAGSSDGPTRLLAHALDLAGDGGTARLGRLLAPMGVRWIVVPQASAPEIADGELRPAPVELLSTLASQIDLEREPTPSDLIVYENRAWVATVSRPPGDERSAGVIDDWREAAFVDLRRSQPVLVDRDGHARYQGRLEGRGPVVLAAASSERWTLEVDGQAARPSQAYGWANRFDVDAGGSATLRYDTPVTRWLLIAGQGFLWLVAIVAWRATRRRDHRILGVPRPRRPPVVAPPLALRRSHDDQGAEQ